MSGATNRGRDLGNRLILSLVFVSSGLLVFMVAGYLAVLPDGTRISTSVRTAIKIAVFATTLGATWHVYRSERWTPYRGVSLALFAGASGVLLSRFVSDWPVAWLNWPVDTPHGTAARKLSEAVPMVVPGLLLMKV